jgi:hypothetical protein
MDKKSIDAITHGYDKVIKDMLNDILYGDKDNKVINIDFKKRIKIKK